MGEAVARAKSMVRTRTGFELDTSRILSLVLIIEIVVLFGNAVILSRDYQDSWILEGLEIPFVLFVATYALAFFSEKRISWMVALAVIGRCVFLLIPNLKYVWFQGIAIDQHVQYSLANYVYNVGYIASQDNVYIGMPLMHLDFAIFSTILKIPVVYSIKYLPVLLSPIYPLLIYSVMKNLKFPMGKTALKYALFISSVPIHQTTYIIGGVLFGVLLMFLILSQIVRSMQKRGRRYWFVLVFFSFALVAAHSPSFVQLIILLSTILILQNVSFLRIKSYLKTPTVLAIMSIGTAWLMFPAKKALESIVNGLAGMLGGTPPKQGYVPSRFFELAHIDMLGAIRSVLVFNGADAFLLLLTMAGLIILLKMRKSMTNSWKFLFLFNGLLFLFIPIGFLSKVGGSRWLSFARISFPIFSSIFILYASKRRVWIRAVIFSSIILLSTLQLYACQPLIPSASVLSKNLPTDEPLVYVVNVNSVYQRQMIKFAENHVRGRIACDTVTKNQIIGLTEYNFSSAHVMWYYPLSRLADKSAREIEYDYFLIHLPGISGTFGEHAEIRTKALILDTIYNSNILYNNGESYILTHNPA